MTRLRALIFDVDGTLAETEPYGHRVAFNCAFAEAEWDWEWPVDLYGELLEVAGGKERIHFYWQQYRPDFPTPDNVEELIAKVHKAKTQHYQKLLAKGAIPLRPGVKRLLTEAHTQGMRLAIATTSALPNVHALLQNNLGADSLSWFEVIAAGDIVPAKKPAPDIYNYVLREMELESQDCLAIEDSYQGLNAALQAGIKTVITVNDYTKAQDFSGALLVLNHLGEPDLPFSILTGDVAEASYLDMALIQVIGNW